MQQEIRLLKQQHARSSEIISQLKDAEKSQAALVSNFEKQLSELKNAQLHFASNQKEAQRRLTESQNTIDSLKNQVSSLSEALKVKDNAVLSEADGRRKAENELERTLVKLESVERSLEARNRQESEDKNVEALRVSTHSYMAVKSAY